MSVTTAGNIVRMRVQFIEKAAEQGDFQLVLDLLTVFKQDVEYLGNQAVLTGAKRENERLATV